MGCGRTVFLETDMSALFVCSVIRMSEDMTQKMLRAVLQSNKNGVSITRLQSDFKSLTGEFIPHRQRGYPSLEAYLRTMPSVARLDYRMGEVGDRSKSLV